MGLVICPCSLAHAERCFTFKHKRSEARRALRDLGWWLLNLPCELIQLDPAQDHGCHRADTAPVSALSQENGFLKLENARLQEQVKRLSSSQRSVECKKPPVVDAVGRSARKEGVDEEEQFDSALRLGA